MNQCLDEPIRIRACFYLLQEAHHEQHISAFLQKHRSLYRAVDLLRPEEPVGTVDARNLAL